MDLVSILVASVIGMMAVMGTFQGIASAINSQVLLKYKTNLVIESQGANNVLQDAVACTKSIGTQNVYYNNGNVAYSAGDGTIGTLVWSTQGSATVLTINPNHDMLRPVVLNLNCTAATTSTTASTTAGTTTTSNIATNASNGNANPNNSSPVTSSNHTSDKPCN